MATDSSAFDSSTLLAALDPTELDWAGCGASALRGVLGEAWTAEHAHRTDGTSARWVGGNTPGYDVISDHARYDGKAVTRDRYGRIVLCRFGGKPFNPERVDYITLVEVGPARTGWRIDDGQATLFATAKFGGVFDVPVPEMNRLMPEPGRYRNVLLRPEALAPWRQQ